MPPTRTRSPSSPRSRRRDATLVDHDPGRAAAHPAGGPRAADRDVARPRRRLDHRSTRPGCTTRGGRRSIPRRGEASSSAATAFRSPRSTRSGLSWSGARGSGAPARVSVGPCPSPTATAPSSIRGGVAAARGREGGGDPRRPRAVAGAVLPAARPPDRHRRRAGARSDARQAAAPPPRCARAGADRARRRRTPLTPASGRGRRGRGHPPGTGSIVWCRKRPSRGIASTTSPGCGPRRRPPRREPPHARLGRAAVGGPRHDRARRASASSARCSPPAASCSSRRPSPTATPLPTVTPVVDTTYDVVVLNATPEQGLATQMKDVVVAAGWADGHRAGQRGRLDDFPETTIYYLAARRRGGRGRARRGDRRREDRAERRLPAGRQPAMPSSSRS